MQPNFDEFLDSPSIPKDVSFLQSDGLLHQPSSVLPAYEHLPESRAAMEELTPEEWYDLNLYWARYNQEQQARQALDMLAASKDSPSYGFRVNNYRHCLQCATMLYQDGADEETIVCGLFHDLGFIVCPDNHGEFSATLLANYISEKNHWMLRHHALFLDHHASGNLQLDANARESYRGHPYFEYTAEWVARYDQTAIQTQYETAPLEFFESMVYRVFTRPSKGVKIYYWEILMSAWIHMVPLEEATGTVRDAYELAKTPSGTVDNVMRAHSLRPHTMVGHLKLYRSVLHHPDNSLPLWFLEAVGVYTSLLNECVYSYTHHFANMQRLLEDPQRSKAIEDALRDQVPERAFTGKELALIRYTGKLTLTPGKISEQDLLDVREVGASDGEILEVNQVCAYFCYSNRTLNGLGVQLGEDAIGFYKE